MIRHIEPQPAPQAAHRWIWHQPGRTRAGRCGADAGLAEHHARVNACATVVALGVIEQLLQGVGMEPAVAGVEELHPLATAVAEAEVHGREDAARRVIAHQLEGSHGLRANRQIAAVHHHHLQGCRHLLAADRGEGVLQLPGVVAGEHDDAHQGWGCCWCHRLRPGY